MNPDDLPQTLALAAVLTTAGTTAFAALITGLIELLKRLDIPGVVGHEPRVVALLAAIFVSAGVANAIQAGVLALDLTGLFMGFTAWYALCRLSMSIYDDITGGRASLTVGLAEPATLADPK